MNDTNDDAIGTLLNEAASALRPTPEFRERLRARLVVEARNPEFDATAPRAFPAGRSRAKRFAIAASLLLCGGLAFATVAFWSAQPTLADVERRVAQAPWVRLDLSDGRVRWYGAEAGIVIADDRAIDGMLSLRSRRAGTHEWYLPREQTIVRWRVDPKYFTTDAWSAETGSAQAWAVSVAGSEKGVPQVETEKQRDVIDGRELLRFDDYVRNQLGERMLIQQLWVDEAKQLPVRKRERIRFSQRRSLETEFAEGAFTFPESGPTTLAACGVGPEVRTLDEEVIERASLDAAVVRAMDAARESKGKFPDRFRLVAWSVEGQGPDAAAPTMQRVVEAHVLWWSGRAWLLRNAEGPGVGNFAGCRIRQERIRAIDGPHQASVQQATSGDAVLAAIADAGRGELSIFDDATQFALTSPTADGLSGRVSARAVASPMPHSPSTFWPLIHFWPLADQAVFQFPITFAESGPAAAGSSKLVTLRLTQGTEARVDYTLDPDHDWICIRESRSTLKGGAWTEWMATELGDFARLAGGQWVPTTWTMVSVMPQGTIRSRFRIEVTPLSPAEMPAALFDWKSAIEKAKAEGAAVETW